MRSGVRSPRALTDIEASFVVTGEMREVAGGDLRAGSEPLELVGLCCDMFCCAPFAARIWPTEGTIGMECALIVLCLSRNEGDGEASRGAMLFCIGP